MQSFGKALRAMWPNYLVDIESGIISEDMLPAERLIDYLSNCTPTDHLILCFFKTMAMRSHLHRRGFTPSRGGQGPFAIYIRTRRQALFQLDGLLELKAADREPGEVDAYSAWLCCSHCFEVTLVSPSDPASDPFSERLRRLILEACYLSDGT
jgi:hypothetical protein